MGMKAIHILILSILCAAIAFGNSLTLQNFTVKAKGDNVEIVFVSQNEAGLTKYTLERAKKESQNFTYVTDFTPQGNFKSYRFTDEGPFLKPTKNFDEKNSDDIYVYRVTAHFTTGAKSHSDIVQVTHQTSSVAKSWGMLKEMFR
ncbi:MAG: hypothetical protein Kapaf2KO_21430 [Candidatus Kapaibacteriales bacterium]